MHSPCRYIIIAITDTSANGSLRRKGGITMAAIIVNTAKPYPFITEHGVPDKLGEILPPLHPPCRAALLCDDTVYDLYGKQVGEALKNAGYTPLRIALPTGEACKAWNVLGSLLEALAAAGFTRSDLMIALGGGSVCDVGGLAAALYHRGVDIIYLPTTLLADVDAAIGGKTAVDLSAGKNLVGVIRQPLAVIADADCLHTLPGSALADGMAEAVKTGVLAGESLFALVSAPVPDYSLIIERCAAYKADIVAREERDTGIRLTLNLGHTVGHAVEAHSNYRISHGQAVAVGLATMVRAGAALGWCEASAAQRIQAALAQCGLPLRYPCPPEALLDFLWHDKKRQGDTLTAVLPHAIGRCTLRQMNHRQMLRLLQAGV